MRDAPPDQRTDLLLGGGAYLGYELGFAPELLPKITDGLKEQDRAVFERGFEIGARLRWTAGN